MTDELIQRPMGVSTMRRRLLPLLAVLLATSACSGSAADPEDRAKPRSSGASTELTAWLGDLCTANKPMESVSVSNMVAPPVPENTTEADRKPMQTFLRNALDNVGKAQKGLAALRQAPTTAGSKLLNSYRKDIDELYSTLFKYTENVGWFPAESLDAPYSLARLELSTFKGIPFQDNAALTAASRRAPECRYGS